MLRKSYDSRQSFSAGPLRVRNDGGSKTSNIGGMLAEGNRISVGGGRPSSDTSKKQNISKFPLATYGTATQNRRPSSGIGIRGRTEVITDTRPIRDKAFQAKCIRILCEFLSEHNYPNPISTKILQSPTKKDFTKIFEFLFGFCRSSYKIGDKPEEEVPRLLRMLGYPWPCSISKSSMQAVSSGHVWPHVLAALVWLVEHIQTKLSLSYDPNFEFGSLFPLKVEDFDSVPLEKIEFNYLEETYDAYLTGYDSFEPFDEKLDEILKEKYMGSQSIDDLTRENNHLKQESDDLDKEIANQKNMEEKRDILERDETEFRKYIGDLSNHHKALEKQSEELILENQTLSAEKQALLLDIQQKQVVFETQEFKPIDVDRIREKSRELQRQIELLEGEMKEIDADIWKEEISLAKIMGKLETKCSEHNKLGQALKLIPPSAELADGHDLELQLTSMQRMSAELDTIIKPHLLKVLRQSKESLDALEHENQQLSWNVEQKQETLSELEDENLILERDTNGSEEELEFTKEAFRREEQQQMDLLEAMKKDLKDLQMSDQMKNQNAEMELVEIRRRYDQRKKDFKEQEDMLIQFLVTVINEVVSHKNGIQENLSEVLDQCEHLMGETKTDTIRIAEELSKYKENKTLAQ